MVKCTSCVSLNFNRPLTQNSITRILFFWCALTAIFCASIFVRKSLVNKTVSNFDHCDFYLSTTFENWGERGLADCYFSPILTYNNPGDKHVAYYKRLESKQGDNYFVSFPPFTFLFTYTLFKTLHLVPGKLAIQWLNICLHFISAYFIYLLIFRRYNKTLPLQLYTPALAAFTVYMFIPVVLYTHTVVYFPETLGQVFWLIALYQTFRWLNSSPEKKVTNALTLGLVLFFMTYTEWIGIIYAIVFVFFVARSNTMEQYDKKIAIKSVGIASLAALLLTGIQYGSINGVVNLAKAFLLRYSERSGLLNADHSDLGYNFFTLESYWRFAGNLHTALFPYGYLLVLFTVLLLIKNGKSFVLQVLQKNKLLLALSFLPGIVHLFIFFNSTVIHRHCVAVLGVGIAIFSGIAVKYLLSKKISINKAKLAKGITAVFMCITVCLSIWNFSAYLTPLPDYSYLTQVATFIKADAQKEEVIFLNFPTELSSSFNYISFTAKRSILPANDTKEVITQLKKLHKPKAVFYQFNEPRKPPLVYRISIE